MKAGVITFPGSNCDHDLLNCLRTFDGLEVVHLWHKDTDLQGADLVFLPGGFSYGDYLRSGAIARFSPAMQAVQAHAHRGGFVVGICNGFQILTESGLLPGVLRRNQLGQFICKNVYIKPEPSCAPITQNLAPIAYKIPIAHAEGNYFCDAQTLQQLEDNGQIIFRYCNAEAEVTVASNPNGALNNIAGICNTTGNVMGMMPHPERAADTLLANTDGRTILQALLNHCLQNA